MTEHEHPSFSLGLEDDFEIGVGELDELKTYSDNPNPQSCAVVDSDKEEDAQNPSAWSFDSPPQLKKKNLKRLRRGKPIDDVSLSDNIVDISSPLKDEDIEEFSSQDELTPETRNSTPYNSVCSSSKIPLLSSNLQTNRPSGFRNPKSSNQSPNPSLSSTLDLGYKGVMLPKLTISPIRRFQLIDSDSDDNSKTPLKESSKRKKSKQSPDLWKDFEPSKPSRIETPALDEICNEYFNSLHNKTVPKRGNAAVPERGNAAVPERGNETFHRIPAQHYFFNEDERIRRLVSNRLPHFTPLTGETDHSNIDYIGQFKGNASHQQGKTTSKTRTRGKERQVEDQGGTDKPKNVAKRRVFAREGHWYTDSDGTKVYVSKSGDQLSGKDAYLCYKQENGGFKKFRGRPIRKKITK